MNEYHLYRMRHLFKGDEHVGKYDPPTRSLRLREEFADLKDEARAFFMRRENIHLAQVLVGAEALAAVKPRREFPPEILALRTEWGQRTPALIEYANEHFTREEFDHIYEQAPPYEGPRQPPASTAADAAGEPAKRFRKNATPEKQ